MYERPHSHPGAYMGFASSSPIHDSRRMWEIDGHGNVIDKAAGTSSIRGSKAERLAGKLLCMLLLK